MCGKFLISRKLDRFCLLVFKVEVCLPEYWYILFSICRSSFLCEGAGDDDHLARLHDFLSQLDDGEAPLLGQHQAESVHVLEQIFIRLTIFGLDL